MNRLFFLAAIPFILLGLPANAVDGQNHSAGHFALDVAGENNGKIRKVGDLSPQSSSQAQSEQDKFKKDLENKRQLKDAETAIDNAGKQGIKAPSVNNPMKKEAAEFSQQKAKQSQCFDTCKKQNESIKAGIEVRYPCKLLYDKIPQCPPEKPGELAKAEAAYQQCQKNCSSPSQ